MFSPYCGSSSNVWYSNMRRELSRRRLHWNWWYCCTSSFTTSKRHSGFDGFQEARFCRSQKQKDQQRMNFHTNSVSYQHINWEEKCDENREKETTFFFFWLCRAAPAAYGGSQARGPVGAIATSLHHSHSNAGSELHLQPILQRTATPDPLTLWVTPGIKPASSWILVRFATTETLRDLRGKRLLFSIWSIHDLKCYY